MSRLTLLKISFRFYSIYLRKLRKNVVTVELQSKGNQKFYEIYLTLTFFSVRVFLENLVNSIDYY